MVVNSLHLSGIQIENNSRQLLPGANYDYISYFQDHQKTIDPNNPRDYVDSIMISRSNASLRDMAKSTAMFIPDSTDSIADLTRCCLYHCCKYPEEMAKMQKVVDDACGLKPPTLRVRCQHMSETEALFRQQEVLVLAPCVLVPKLELLFFLQLH